MRLSSILLFFLFLHTTLFAQSENGFFKKLKDYKIQPIIGLQMWSTYTFNQEVYNEVSKKYEAVDNRLNTQLRRSRLGVKGQPYKNLKFNVTASLDVVGSDVLSGTQGGGNNGSSPSFRIWNAYVQWKVLNDNEFLNLTVGYLSPRIGRESITSAMRYTSMEKSFSQNYLRRHLVGTGPGRAPGLNIGGLFYKEERKVNLSYDVGIFNPVFASLGGNSTGSKYAPMLNGRVVLHIGDPEFTKYSTSHKVNYFNKRKGLSLALAAAQQGATDLFESNEGLGFDFLLNWGAVNLDGEWTWLKREASRILVTGGEEIFSSSSNTGYARLSYNIEVGSGRYLEPVFMMMQFNGALNKDDQKNAADAKLSAGEDYLFDVGLNYYLNKNFKLSLHYTFQQADAGEAGDGATVNNYFYQKEVGAIHRGDWLGLGLVAVF